MQPTPRSAPTRGGTEIQATKANDCTTLLITTLVVHSKHWSHPRGLYYDLLGKSGSKLKSAETLPVKLEYDIRLMRTRLNEYYLCIPLGTSSRIDNQEPDPTAPCVIALDPGVRTFMTGYDASGRVIKWAVGDTTRIHRLCKEIDSLHKRWGMSPTPDATR